MTPPTMQPPVIDLTDCIPPDDDLEIYTPERVVDWLRSSGGTLGERAMKCAAAEMIEAANAGELAPGVGLEPTTH